MKKSTFTRKTKPTTENNSENGNNTSNTTTSSNPIKITNSTANSGIKPSIIHTSQMVVSSGLDEIDEILQGGIAVGSIVLIEEDKNTRHYKSLLNYFLSEAISSDQAIYVSSSIFNPSKSIISQIPSQQPEEIDVQKQQMEQKAIEEMKIAWRYKSQLKANEKKKISMAHNFDLGQPIDEKTLENNKDIHSFDISPSENVKNDFKIQLEKIKKVVDDYYENFKETKVPKLCRIAIYSFANPTLYDFSNKEYQREALLFLNSLKGILRNSLSVCMISIPTHLFSPNDSFISRIKNISDTVFSVNSFQDSDVKIPDIYNDYTGVIELKKLTSLNIYTSKLPLVLTYLFTRKRKKLFIEELYIPPESTQSTQSQPVTEEKSKGSSKKIDVKSSVCGSGHGHKHNNQNLDF